MADSSNQWNVGKPYIRHVEAMKAQSDADLGGVVLALPKPTDYSKIRDDPRNHNILAGAAGGEETIPDIIPVRFHPVHGFASSLVDVTSIIKTI